jgi:hypothetical protein
MRKFVFDTNFLLIYRVNWKTKDLLGLLEQMNQKVGILDPQRYRTIVFIRNSALLSENCMIYVGVAAEHIGDTPTFAEVEYFNTGYLTVNAEYFKLHLFL